VQKTAHHLTEKENGGEKRWEGVSEEGVERKRGRKKKEEEREERKKGKRGR
jgi:hypothetical protein